MNQTSRIDLVAERDHLLKTIVDLDAQHANGVLADDEYIDLRNPCVKRAAVVLKTLEKLPEDIVTKKVALPQRRSRTNVGSRRTLMAGSAVGFFVAVAIFGAINALNSRDSGETASGSIEGNSNSLLQKAQDQTAEGDVVGAVKTYDKVLAMNANNVQALSYCGWLVRLAGLEDEGLTSIDKAIAIQPTYPDAHFFRGYILLNDKQDAAGAVAEFETFLNNNPPSAMVPLVQNALTDARARVAASN